MKSEEYRTGYSLESLRDLELVPLTTDESRNGFFIHESLQLLFNLVFNGFSPQQLATTAGKPIFRMQPLKSRLFDPANTPLLSRVKFRSFVLQRVLELLSLSRPKGNREGGAGSAMPSLESTSSGPSTRVCSPTAGSLPRQTF